MFYRKTLEHLNTWKNKPDRKPLVLRGARQVGKTTLVDMFSKEFSEYIYLNLEVWQDRQLFENNYGIEELVDAIFFYKKKNKGTEPCLVFIDEIQNSPKAVTYLRYFFEDFKNLYIIAAGSLLESLIDRQISFPVGRVEYLIIRPCSFVEFLQAIDEKQSLDLIKSIPFVEYGHEKLLKLFRIYMLIGGMPEIIQHYSLNRDINSLATIYQGLISGYLDDVEKYARNQTLTQVIRHIINHSFIEAGNRIKFNGFGTSIYKTREVSESFRILEKTLFLQLIYPVTTVKIPLQDDVRKSPKLQLLDTGLVNYAAGLQADVFSTPEIDNVFDGKIAEHITGQELLSLNQSPLYKLNFWTREKIASAELDFVYQYKHLLIPIEVKSGQQGRLRSLHQFIDLSNHPYAVRIYSGKMNIDEAKTIKGTKFFMLNLPFYLINELPEYISWMIETYQ